MENKTCGECRFLGSAKETGVCKKRKICLYPEELPACSKFEQKIITNGDVIHQMSNGAFAFMMTRLILEGCPISKSKTMHDCKVSNDCVSCLKHWLNAPAESEGDDE